MKKPTQPTCYIAHAAICALAKAGKMTAKDVTRAIKQYKIDVEKADPALA